MNTLQALRMGIESLQHHYNNGDLDVKKRELLDLVDQLSMVSPTPETRHNKLSPRENEVMTAILSGQRLKEIAARLDISVKTVTTHRSRLLRKLGVEDNLGLYRYGVRNGLISV
ncbi:MAG TPA: LuxR C-terminal-related transcriptional regulator [Thermoanaerobaculia bacterium]|nr:LuxR C-terminal-related transcriptional regulator [Thermoanaerobaculia bacterium]